MKWMKFIGIFMAFVAAAYFGMIWLAPTEITFQVNEDINAPLEEVYAAYTDASAMNEWLKGVKTVKNVPGKQKPTADLYYEGQGKMVMRHTAELVEANKRYISSNEVDDFFQRNEDTHFEAVDSNLTRLSVKVTIKALSTRMKLFMYAEDTHKKNIATNLEALKARLEG